MPPIESHTDASAPSPSDERLNQDQVAKLIEAEYRGLINLVRSKLRNRELAADLVNEAIVTTLEHAKVGRLTQPGAIGGYVFKVSMNLLRNYQRNSDNRRDLRSSDEALNTIADRDRNDVEEQDLRCKAELVIASLASTRDREVITRFYLDEEEKETICADLKLSPLQFTQVTSRARQRIKAIFDAQGLSRDDLLSVIPWIALLIPPSAYICQALTTFP